MRTAERVHAFRQGFQKFPDLLLRQVIVGLYRRLAGTHDQLIHRRNIPVQVHFVVLYIDGLPGEGFRLGQVHIRRNSSDDEGVGSEVIHIVANPPEYVHPLPGSVVHIARSVQQNRR